MFLVSAATARFVTAGSTKANNFILFLDAEKCKYFEHFENGRFYGGVTIWFHSNTSTTNTCVFVLTKLCAASAFCFDYLEQWRTNNRAAANSLAHRAHFDFILHKQIENRKKNARQNIESCGQPLFIDTHRK